MGNVQPSSSRAMNTTSGSLRRTWLVTGLLLALLRLLRLLLLHVGQFGGSR